MRDRYNRQIEYLRISLTDRCNLRCRYCMPPQGVQPLAHADILRYEQIVQIVQAVALLGIKKIRLTGGEPLVRRGAVELVRQLKQIAGIETVALTTNGVLLAEQLDELCDAGLDAVNLSLDTLDPQIFQQLTGADRLAAVQNSLQALLAKPQLKLKLNCVPLVGVNEASLLDLAALARDYPLEVRFIELMPIGCAYENGCRGLKEAVLRERLAQAFGPLLPTPDKGAIKGPARSYRVVGFRGTLGFINAIDHKFCEKCNRVRLTADGFLKLCLNSAHGIDVKQLLQEHDTPAALAAALAKVIYNKPQEHFFLREKENKNIETRKMFQIGG